jgi:alpha-beta hydrolase superfamily lysophospholipase
MGGMIAMEAAASDPSRFRSLILSATCSKYNPPSPKGRKQFSVKEQIQNFRKGSYSDEEWLHSHDERFPRYETNRDRMLGKLFF